MPEDMEAPERHGPTEEEKAQYEKLRERGLSEEKAASLAYGPQDDVETGEDAYVPYEELTEEELFDLAKKADIERHTEMDKGELIEALRNT